MESAMASDTVTPQPIWNFEQDPTSEEMDETSVNLKAHFDRMADNQLQQYREEWTDDQVVEWDGNFTEEGTLLLACSERDVDVQEYRRVLRQNIEYRNRVRPTLA